MRNHIRPIFAGATLAVLTGGMSFAQGTIPALEAAGSEEERARVEGLIEQAREEGELKINGTYVTSEQAAEVLEKFKAHYGLEDTETIFTAVIVREMYEYVTQALANNSNDLDILWINTPAWNMELLEKGELMEYHSPYYDEYTTSNDLGFSREGYWVSDAYAFTGGYNVGEMSKYGLEDWNPTSWNDFTDPRLEGIMSGTDPNTVVTSWPVFHAFDKYVGKDWLHDWVVNTKPVIFSRSSQGRDWLASGEVPVTVRTHAKNAKELLDNNVEVKLVYPEEGVVMNPLTPVILEQAPHPATAKLFIDYVRSAEGAQAVMDSGALMFFGRPDVQSPNKDILPDWTEVKTMSIDWWNGEPDQTAIDDIIYRYNQAQAEIR